MVNVRMTPRFSIIIPTRERPNTLKYTLLTCLHQDFENYEIIVCDNNCSPLTKAVIEEINSEKVVYVRSDRTLAMSDNWELAVSYAKGDYLILIGDDDGLLQNSLGFINEILLKYKSPVLRWNRIYYNWPDIPIKNAANEVHIPLNPIFQFYTADFVIPKVANFELDYTILPMMYNSAINGQLVKKAKEMTGRVFIGPIPDIYSGFIFAYLAKEYLSINYPLTINGGSASSNGLATVVLKEESSIAKFNELNFNSNLLWHKNSPNLYLMPAIIANCFFYAKDNLFPRSKYEIGRYNLINNCMKELKANTESDFLKHKEIIRDSIKDDNDILKWFDQEYGDIKFVTCQETYNKTKNYISLTTLHFNAGELKLLDIFALTSFIKKIINPPYFKVLIRHQKIFLIPIIILHIFEIFKIQSIFDKIGVKIPLRINLHEFIALIKSA